LTFIFHIFGYIIEIVVQIHYRFQQMFRIITFTLCKPDFHLK